MRSSFFSRSGGRRKAGRRDRGGGRGRGRETRRGGEKPVYIEQQGIFSMGLNDDGRHDRPRTSNG